MTENCWVAESESPRAPGGECWGAVVDLEGGSKGWEWYACEGHRLKRGPYIPKPVVIALAALAND